jgi:hypothetical protein
MQARLMFQDTIPDDPAARQHPTGDSPPAAPMARPRRVHIFFALAALLASVWVASR